jgi:adenylosuccinate lyase
MVPRYDLPEISSLWTEDAKFGYFLTIEKALLKALEESKVIPAVSKNFSKVKINLKRIHEIESKVHHDVIAFCSSITEQVSEDSGKYFHFGCTSSDIIDTALSLQIRDSLKLEIAALSDLKKALWKKAQETKTLMTLGRSHGMYAEPMSFGFKFLSYVAEFSRRLDELKNYEKNLTGQMSGAVGNYTILTPKIEEKVLKLLNLKVESLSTQVIPRDRLVTLASIQAGIANALERLSIEIRHLHRSDVAEVVEGFKPGQKGSSTMPHKKNPISSENISGLARVIRSHEMIAHENTLLWHERDISHSSSERLWLPDSFGLTVYALKRATKMITELHINHELISSRAEAAFVTASSYFLHKLLPHFKGTREELYALIQEVSFKAKDKKQFEKLLNDKCKAAGVEVKHIPKPGSLAKIYKDQIDEVYGRISVMM